MASSKFSFYVHHKNLLELGMGEFYSLLRLGSYGIIGLTFLKVWMPELKSATMTFTSIIGGVIFLIASWSLGKFLDTKKINHLRAEWSNKRNPSMQKLLKNEK